MHANLEVALFVTISREKEKKLSQVPADLREVVELPLVVLCGRTESWRMMVLLICSLGGSSVEASAVQFQKSCHT
jgi:hypothetical protein